MVFDVPFMLLLHKLNLPPYLGAAVSSICGYMLSSFIALYTIKKEYKMKYMDTYKTILKMLVPIISRILVLLIIRLVPFNTTNIISNIIYIGINTIIGGFVYIFISQKMGLMDDILGEKRVNKIKEKLALIKGKLHHIHRR